MVIFQDGRLNGQWHYCLDCKQRGDLAELAALVWQMPLRESVTKLQRLGVLEREPTDLEYERYYQSIEQRQRLDKLWATAKSERLKHYNTIVPVLQTLGIKHALNSDRAQQLAGHLFGAAICKEVEYAYAPRSVGFTKINKYDKIREGMPSSQRVFLGRDWTNALGVPFYDLPGRLRGFWWCGREGNLAQDVTLRVAGAVREDLTPCAGLAYHPAVEDMVANNKNVLIVVPDVPVYLKLQLRNVSLSDSPLPLICWPRSEQYPGNAHCWPMFERHRKVLWANAITAELIHQAITLRAPISTSGPPLGSNWAAVAKWASTGAPHDILAAVKRQARPWFEVLSEWLMTATDPAIETVALRLQRFRYDLEELADKLNPQARRKLVNSVDYSPALSATETGSGWRVGVQNGQLVGVKGKQVRVICNVVPRIDRILVSESTQQLVAHGKILCDGKEYEFSEKHDSVVNKTRAFLQRTLLLAGCSTVLTFKSLYGLTLYNAMTMYHKPIVEKAHDQQGWDDRLRAFAFPGYVLRQDGTESDVQLFAAGQSRSALRAGQFLSPLEMTELTRRTENNLLLWQIAITVLDNALRGVRGQALADTVICAAPHTAIAKILQQLGCPEYWVDHTPHNWSVRSRTNRRELLEKLSNKDADPAGLAALARDQVALYRLVQGNASAVWSAKTFNVRRVNYELLPHIVTGYLRWLCERGEIKRPPKGTRGVARSLARWVAELRGQRRIVRKAFNTLSRHDDPEGHAWVIGQQLAYKMATGKLRSVPLSHWTDARTELAAEATRTFLPADLVCTLIDLGERSYRWTPAEVERQLKLANALLERDNIQGHPGWWVDGVWWRRYMQERHEVGLDTKPEALAKQTRRSL